MIFTKLVWLLLCSSVSSSLPEDYSRLMFDTNKAFNLQRVYDVGFTGEGVTVGLVSTGEVYSSHTGLNQNYREDLFYDACRTVNKRDSIGDQGFTETIIAGLIAMEKDGQCGTGIAYNAKITGIRWMCYCMSNWNEDTYQSQALKHRQDAIDIYYINKNRTPFTELPGKTKSALKDGFNKGRKTRGTVFLHTVDNDSPTYELDDTVCGGYPHSNNPYVISVNAASLSGKELPKRFRCASIYTTAYARETNEPVIKTTYLRNQCASFYTGSFQAGAFASGILALILSANDALTPRDIRHIMALGSEVKPLADNHGWRKNKAGFWVSTSFGFGLMDARNMVNMAKHWGKLPPLIIESSPKKKGQINYLEEVEVTVSIKTMNRNSLFIFLTSPSGLNVTLLEPLPGAPKYKGKSLNLTFKSTQTWGENPHGLWTFQVKDTWTKEVQSKIGVPKEPVLKKLEIKFYGTKEPPGYSLPRRYNPFSITIDEKEVFSN